MAEKKKTMRVEVRLTPAEMEALTELARRRGATKTAAIVEAVNRALETERGADNGEGTEKAGN